MTTTVNSLLKFKQAREQLDCGSTKLYRLLQDGILRGRKMHGRWYVDEGSIRDHPRACG